MPETSKRYVRAPAAASLLGVSVPTVWRWVRVDPTFPRKILLSPRVAVWNAEELRAWAEARRVVEAEPEPVAVVPAPKRKRAPSVEAYA